MGISYKVGDATNPEGSGDKLIVHVCNNAGGWGAGFVVALTTRWSEPEAAYRRWYRRWYRSGRTFQLGAVQIVRVESTVAVANLLAQEGYRTKENPQPLRYDALRTALAKVAARIEPTTTIHMPRIGTGLGGGDWSTIEGIINETLCAAGFDVIVYDLKK